MTEKEASPELTETNPPTEDMDIQTLAPPVQNPDDVADSKVATNGGSKSKREREEGGENTDEVSKKQMVEKSADEDNLEEKKSEPSDTDRVRLGPKEFGSSVEMFDYFYNLLHYWPTQLNLSKYEHMVLIELLKKGHVEPDKKIGGGIKAFRIRFHPTWKSKCFFAIREDETVDDFSFRKCVDHILPLPEDMKKPDTNNRGSGRGGKGGKGGGRDRGKRW